MVGANSCVQALVILSAPILTRIYTPEEFGIFASYSAIFTILTVISGFRLEFAIPVAYNQRTAFHVLIASLLMILVTTLLVSLIYFALLIFDYKLKLFQIIKSYFPYLMIALIAAGIYQSLNYWAIRHKQFKIIARTNITQKLVHILSQLVFGVVGMKVYGLIGSHCLTQFFGLHSLFKSNFIELRDLSAQFSVKRLLGAIGRYKNFPLISCPASLLNTINSQILLLFTVEFYDVHTAGLLSLSFRTIAVPLKIIGSATGQVFGAEAARLIRENPQKLLRLFYRTFRKLSIIAFAALLILFPISYQLTNFFGGQWSGVESYFRILLIISLGRFIVSPLSMLGYYEFQLWNFYWEITKLITLIILFLLAFKLQLSFISLLAIFCLVMLFFYCVLFILNIIAINKKINLHIKKS